MKTTLLKIAFCLILISAALFLAFRLIQSARDSQAAAARYEAARDGSPARGGSLPVSSPNH